MLCEHRCMHAIQLKSIELSTVPWPASSNYSWDTINEILDARYSIYIHMSSSNSALPVVCTNQVPTSVFLQLLEVLVQMCLTGQSLALVSFLGIHVKKVSCIYTYLPSLLDSAYVSWLCGCSFWSHPSSLCKYFPHLLILEVLSVLFLCWLCIWLQILFIPCSSAQCVICAAANGLDATGEAKMELHSPLLNKTLSDLAHFSKGSLMKPHKSCLLKRVLEAGKDCKERNLSVSLSK